MGHHIRNNGDQTNESIDPRAEGLVQNALDRVSVDKTTLVIAHKLATVRTADNIVVMSYGRVMEQGTHQELIEKDGQYAALVRAQDLGSGGDQPDFSKEEADVEMERTITLQRTKTETKSVPAETEIERLTAGTVGMGLWRCVYLMLMEQEGLTPWFIVGTLACLIGGGTYPAQAILFSRLINVFVLPPGEAQKQADFFSKYNFGKNDNSNPVASTWSLASHPNQSTHSLLNLSTYADAFAFCSQA